MVQRGRLRGKKRGNERRKKRGGKCVITWKKKKGNTWGKAGVFLWRPEAVKIKEGTEFWGGWGSSLSPTELR